MTKQQRSPYSATTSRVLGLAVASLAVGSCAHAPSAESQSIVAETRWLSPSEATPHGRAPGAKLRQVSSEADGTKAYALILAPGDEALAALTTFATDQKVQTAHFAAIGGVLNPEVAWYDEERKQFQAMTLRAQLEVVSLVGDIALGPDGKPIIHAHAVFAGSDGHAWGGHVLSAPVSPTFEIFVTTYPTALHKRAAPETGISVIDPAIAP